MVEAMAIVVVSTLAIMCLVSIIKEMVLADINAKIESVVDSANKALGEVRGEIKELKNEINKRG